jgi:hypothetical protein
MSVIRWSGPMCGATRWFLVASAMFGILGIAGCNPQQSTASVSASVQEVSSPDLGPSYPAGVSGLNYTTYGIARFSITDSDGKTGGGPNIFPSNGDGKPAGGDAETCCVRVPAKWHKDMTVTVRWERDTHPYDDSDRSGDKWLTAVATVPPYGPTQYNFWVQFLDGDRIRVRVADGSPFEKPHDGDPYVSQGVLDEEMNREVLAAKEREKVRAEIYRQQLSDQAKQAINKETKQ